MTEKRDARGTLRDYEKELKGEFSPVLFGLFQSFEIFSMAFPATSFIEPNSNSPWRGFSAVDKTDSTHTAFSVATTEGFGITTVSLWCNKSEIRSAVVESVSVDMVYKRPTVFRFSYNVIMDKIIAKPGIAIVALIKFYPLELLLVDIIVKDSMSYKFMAHIVHGRFYSIIMDNSICQNSVLIDRGELGFTTGLFPIVMQSAQSFGEMWAIAPFYVAYHTNIITKNNKVSRRKNG